MNLYRFGRNNPVVFQDPNGTFSFEGLGKAFQRAAGGEDYAQKRAQTLNRVGDGAEQGENLGRTGAGVLSHAEHGKRADLGAAREEGQYSIIGAGIPDSATELAAGLVLGPAMVASGVADTAYKTGEDIHTAATAEGTEEARALGRLDARLSLAGLLSLTASAAQAGLRGVRGAKQALSLGDDAARAVDDAFEAEKHVSQNLGLADDVDSTTQQKAMVVYDGRFAARQILGEEPVTPGGRDIMHHAAERMVGPPKGRVPMSKTDVDKVLNEGDKIRKVSPHPDGDTVTVQNTKMPGKPQVVVDANTGKRVITVVNPKRKR